jgi:parallel beta-helix repeat protein
VNYLGVGSAAVKIANGRDLTFRRNVVEANIGNGIWCDVAQNCANTHIHGNIVRGNTRHGIFIEISTGPVLIERNTVVENNCSPNWWPNVALCPTNVDGRYGPLGWGAGISMVDSLHVVVRDNTLRGNMRFGIRAGNASRTYDPPFDILVERNALNGDAMDGCSLSGVACR